MSDPNSFQDGRLRNHTLPYSQSQSDQQQIVSRAQQNEFLVNLVLSNNNDVI